jgi:hypothetical protein
MGTRSKVPKMRCHGGWLELTSLPHSFHSAHTQHAKHNSTNTEDTKLQSP